MTSFFWYRDLKWLHLKMLTIFHKKNLRNCEHLTIFWGWDFFGPKIAFFRSQKGGVFSPSSHADSTIGATRSPWGSEWSFLVPFIGGKVAYNHPNWQEKYHLHTPEKYHSQPMTSANFGGRKFLENFLDVFLRNEMGNQALRGRRRPFFGGSA